VELMNESDDPESMRDTRTEFGSKLDVNESIRALDWKERMR